ncbi:MAG: hypothetical protein ACOC6O_01150 [Chloroflexota bacterium]
MNKDEKGEQRWQSNCVRFVVAPLWERATKRKALSIVVSPVPPVADLASADVATLLKKKRGNTRLDWSIVGLPSSREV